MHFLNMCTHTLPETQDCSQDSLAASFFLIQICPLFRSLPYLATTHLFWVAFRGRRGRDVSTRDAARRHRRRNVSSAIPGEFTFP